ncbi:MAG TPA: hypothetical protein VFW53_04535 [Gallionella sp.]|nr:hypothetical protein [Gallionella sp.]
MSIKKIAQAMASAGLMTIAASSQAVEVGGVDLSGSGFLTVGVGSMLGGTRQNVNGYNCPCFASDYAQAGVYDGRNGLQFQPDSKLGLQGTASLDNRRFSVTAQAVARGAQNGNVNLEWLYASYKINDQFTVQAGRKRLPMFYYSDTQDVGVALPWTHLPPQLYGWEAVNYNGVNLSYQGQWGDWSASADMLFGNETKKGSGYWKIYNGKANRTDIKWKNIVGGDLTLSKDWLETRFVYLQSDNQSKFVSGIWDANIPGYNSAPITTEFGAITKQQIYGVTVNVDYNNWLLRSEAIQIDHPGATWKDLSYIVGGGYRYGKWQPLVTWSRYLAVATNGADPSAQEGHYTVALTLRYDLSTSSAVKAQLDMQRDRSGPNYHPNYNLDGVGNSRPYGNADLLTVTYDMVF